jgi:hypothetical protein
MTSKKKGPRVKFAKLEIDMVYSDAYQDLNLSARKILDYFLLQQRWVNIAPASRNPKWELEQKDNIQLKYSTFKKPPFRMQNQSVTRGIDSLLSHGFIEVSKQGGRCRGSVSEFKKSEKWRTWRDGEILSKRQPLFSRGFTKDDV